MKLYIGLRDVGSVSVTVNGFPLNPRKDLRDYDADTFHWGHMGRETGQLAIALLADCINDECAVRHHYKFDAEVVQHLAHDRWTLTDKEIRAQVVKISAL